MPSGNANMGGGTAPGMKLGGMNSEPSGGNCFGSGHLNVEKSLTESNEPLISSNGIVGGWVIEWISKSGSAGVSGILLRKKSKG